MERRYPVIPGLGSSHIHIIDTKPDPRNCVCASSDALLIGESFPLVRFGVQDKWAPGPDVQCADCHPVGWTTRFLLRIASSRLHGGVVRCPSEPSQLDAVLKEVEDHRDEDIVCATQLRRHEDQLQKHESRIAKLKTAQAIIRLHLCSSRNATTARRKSRAATKRLSLDSAGPSSHFADAAESHSSHS